MCAVKVFFYQFIMKLTLVLLRRNRLPNGHLFRGKDRLVKQVETKHLNKIKQNFAIEEQNMLYLRFPYLTEVCIFNFICKYKKNMSTVMKSLHK